MANGKLPLTPLSRCGELFRPDRSRIGARNRLQLENVVLQQNVVAQQLEQYRHGRRKTERSAHRARARTSERFAFAGHAVAATRPAEFERRARGTAKQPLLTQLSSFRHGRASSRPSTPYSVAGCKDVDARHKAGHDEKVAALS